MDPAVTFISTAGSPDEVLYIGNNDDNLIGWTLETNPSTVAGGDGNDVLFGGINNSEIDGGSGNDAIYPGKGSNLVLWRSGNDIISSGIGGGFFEGGQMMTPSLSAKVGH